jgi:hypothetical protein
VGYAPHDVSHTALVLLADEHNCGTFVPGSACASRAMQVCLGIVGDIPVHHQVHVIHIQASSGDIGCHQHMCLALQNSYTTIQFETLAR